MVAKCPYIGTCIATGHSVLYVNISGMCDDGAGFIWIVYINSPIEVCVILDVWSMSLLYTQSSVVNTTFHKFT